MKKYFLPKSGKLLVALSFLIISILPIMGGADLALAQTSTITAASCNQTDVQNAVNSASAGTTVRVPAGTCSWSGLSISGIQLVGAGKSTSGTVITSGGVTITKHSSQYTRVGGFRFTGSDTHVSVSGSPSSKPYIIDNNYFFNAASGRILAISVNGGLLHHNDFYVPTGTGVDNFNIVTGENWSEAPTFGNTDTNGERNIYIEDNTFTNFLETAPDGDQGGRFVIRHNTYIDSTITFHGGAPADTSGGGGTRQFEVYSNTFQRVLNSAPVNKWIWIRGASGVIANNSMDRADSPDGSSYNNKSEIRLTLGCSGSYPMQYQTGQSNQSPENPPSHPVLIFGNTGAGTTDSNFISIEGSNTSSGTGCSSPSSYIQLNRDYFLSNQWNWVPYTYPHPLQALSGPISSTTPTPTPTTTFTPTPTPTPTPNPTDTTPPVISGVGVSNITQFSASIVWTTNELADGQLEFPSGPCPGTTNCLSPLVTTLTTSHIINVSNLNPGTGYTYRVRSRDAAGNLAISFNQSFITLTVAPSPTPTPTPTPVGGPAPLPQGNNGIAAQYPGDVNITSNSNVIFADGFENYTSTGQLTSSGNYNNYFQQQNLSLDTSTFFGGAKSLKITMSQSGVEVSNALVKNIVPNKDTLFMRVYARYQPNYAGVIDAHNGLGISGKYVGPGIKPDGMGISNGFLVFIENSRYLSEGEPGYSNAYVYHPEQNDFYGEHWYPDGTVSNGTFSFGPYFIVRPKIIPPVGQWVSYEVLVQLNTPGSRDGRVAVWQDGTLIADWQNIRFRDTSTLKIDQISLSNGGKGSSQQNDKWYDNLVLASSYIGPMNTGSVPSPTPTPTPVPGDTTPPVISNVTVTNITPFAADVNWTTNELADGQVAFCTTYNTACANNTPLVSALTTSHVINLSGLTANTYYYTWIKSKDASGNLRTYYMTFRTALSATPTPTPGGNKFIIGDRVTPNIHPPDTGALARSTPSLSDQNYQLHNPGELGTVIGGPITADGYIWWNINYDIGMDGWSTEPNLDKVTTNVTPTPTPTPTPIDFIAPYISNVTVTNITQFAADVNWTTNEPADGQIAFCTTYNTACANNTPLVPNLTTSHIINLSGLTPNTYYYMWIKSKD